MATRPPLPPLARVFGYIGLGLLALIVLVAAALLALNTRPGRSFIAQRIEALAPENGLRFDIGRIEGSVFGALVIRDLRVSDPKGVFAIAPLVRLDWRPAALVRSHVVVNALTAPTLRVLRRPALSPVPDTGEPILPDIDIDVGRLAIVRIILEPPVIGRRVVASLGGRASIADRRARVVAVARSSTGDRIALHLDAAPDNDRFDLAATIQAPADAVVTGLAGLRRPLVAHVDGAGSWSRWQGRARARVAGAPLLDLGVTARNGQFEIAGTAYPERVLGPGAAARLTAPAVRVHAAFTAEQRVVIGRVSARSAALALTGAGTIDFAEGRFSDLRIDAQLLRPAALVDNAHGRAVRLAVVIDGPVGRPVVAYTLGAPRIGFGTATFERFSATGTAVLGDAPLVLPVSAQAARVLGVSPTLGGLLTNLRVTGRLRITADQVVSDDLQIRSDRLAGTAVLAYTFRTGDYDIALKGALNRYVIDGLGIVDLSTDARVVPDGRGGFTVRGTVVARGRRIDSAGARALLGGQPVITAAIERMPSGDIRFTNGRLRAPSLRIDNGRGIYRASGTITFTGDVVSRDYGRAVVSAEGPLQRPTIRLRAPRPTIGVPFTDVDARLTPSATGYAIAARGRSPWGPFSLAAALGLGTQQTLEIRSFRLAGLEARGRLLRTVAGPWAGALAIAGPGLTGNARLSAAGSVQRADIAMRAANARLALAPPLTIRTGQAQAVLLLAEAGPTITGSATLAGVRQHNVRIEQMTATANYRAGTGRAQLSASGRRAGAPFSVVGDADFSPSQIRVAAQGSANRVPLRLAQPAELRRTAGGWRLAPATLLLPDGRLVVAGTFGTRTAVEARLVDANLDVLRALVPELRLGGRASGRVDVALPGRENVPAIRANLRISDLTRAGIAGVSLPVAVTAVGGLGAEGGTLRVVVRRQASVVGRIEARMAPLPGGASQPWAERLLAAPLAGGIRYNGPAEVLWALSGMPGHDIRGPVAIGADFAGRVSAPNIRGVARATDLRYESLAYGTVLDDIRLDSRFTGSRLELTALTATAGEGTVTASGTIGLSGEQGFPLDIGVQLQRARVADSRSLRAIVSGPLRITNAPRSGARISGELTIDRARYRIIREEAAQVPQLRVRRRGEPLFQEDDGAAAGPPSVWNLAVTLRAANELFVQGMGLESEWQAKLRIGGDIANPRIAGPVDLVRGTYSFAGRRFELARGAIRFTGNVPPDPMLDIRAEAQVEAVNAYVTVGGTATRPEIAFGATPALPQEEVLSRLLFGGSVAELSPLEAVQLAGAVNSLRGSGDGLNPLGQLRKATGFDRLRVLGEDEASGRGTAIAIGEYIGRNIYVELTTDARGNTVTQLEINLTRALKLLTQVGAFSGNSIGIRYAKER